MDEEKKSNGNGGFTMRVRLGDLLTMFSVFLAFMGISGAMMFTYASTMERLARLETRQEMFEALVKERLPAMPLSPTQH